MDRNFIIGTRGSKLALWQAEFVRSKLIEHWPQSQVEIKIIKTSGDVIQNRSLVEIGGRGVFTKELENALTRGEIDLAVHSLKDLPTILPDELHLSAVLPREDVRDAVVFRADLHGENSTLANLPENSIVGTSSSRRFAQLKNLRPDLQLKDIRGNVDTRLRKLDDGEYTAIMLAVAGLKRLGLAHRISIALSVDEMLPQVGQGALGIETRRDDAETNEFVQVLNDEKTRICVTAERQFLRGLGGGCQFPIAALGVVENDELHLRGLVAALDGTTILRGAHSGKIENPQTVGVELAETLLAQGASDLINQKHDAGFI